MLAREWTESTFKQGAPLEIDRIFKAAIKLKASDIHLQVGRPPVLRIRGTLRELDQPPITEEGMIDLLFPMMDQRNLDIFHRDGGADFAKIMDLDGDSWRFRVNLLTQMGKTGMVARRIERFIPDFNNLNLPPVMESLCKFDQGMVLLAGVTGSGKSTTIASMLNWVNHNMRKHILTIEDPIEYIYEAEKCLINQREIGQDVIDFEVAMKHAVREDPDIMLVGELRDRETFETAIHAAETGHLVFGTIHASTAPSTIGRILDLFPQDMHAAIRSSMVFNMKAIVAQKLLPTILEGEDAPKRVPIVEIMTFNPTVRKLIMEEKDEKLAQAISLGKQEGMQKFNDSLQYFVEKDFISRAVAFEVSPNAEELKMALKGINVKGSSIL
ncbi:type IV pilus twitching motility protein PilT [Alienimonas californiensis]|uniref:Twitching mobility protein n=1 Tax=Alienimonas californiensis TaxID=2527989 RepID=A0A517PFQ8_9PLAN|nr:PilT/PilU family type 4a pilus ATPase [Alienimonas californiensis]QDT18210.1 Twitching mobility protein [Alienimonas californiensis]